MLRRHWWWFGPTLRRWRRLRGPRPCSRWLCSQAAGERTMVRIWRIGVCIIAERPSFYAILCRNHQFQSMIMQPSRWGEINDEALQKLSILGQLGNLDHYPGSMCICLVDDKCIWLQYPQLIPSNKCDWLRLCISRKSDMTRRLDQASVVNLNNRLPTSSAYNCSCLRVSTSKTISDNISW